MADKKKKEILVVDHELADLELMCRALRMEGYKALPASGYLSGINTFAMHLSEIHLVVTAVALPEKNGCELAKNLTAVNPNLRVLFVSGMTGAEVCRFYGMLGEGLYFLEKPLNRDEFVRMVRLILEPAVPVRTMGAT
jgi:two-component system, cell cycle sensor histidine kinase and response regulator CckA